MDKTTEEFEKLRIKAEASINKTTQLQQVLAQIEATLSRNESQKATQKSKNI